MKSLHALIDCNSFFVSCEKLFRPDLADKPVVVLSNNDGVVVSRSQQAKQLGIAMGEPYFKIKRMVEHAGLVVFSSNFRLYGDMSNRVMQTLLRWTPHVEVYSIDEAFLDFSDLGLSEAAVEPLLTEIVATVKKWTGIPISIGLGPTKTLAKVANDIAKKSGGACNLLHREQRSAALARLPIGDVWGVGRRLAPKMAKLGIRTAADLAAIDPIWMRRHFSVIQEKLVRELQGESCLDVEETPQAKKSIQVSRSFRDATDHFDTLAEAVATFAAKACEKARQQCSVATGVYVHMNTSRFNGSYISDGIAEGFDRPTGHSPEVIRTAVNLLRRIYRPGPQYKKATVILLELRDAAAERSQGLLFPIDDKMPEQRAKEERLMASLDAINRRVGRGTVFFGAEGTETSWKAASDHASPGYTTRWSDLPVAHAR